MKLWVSLNLESDKSTETRFAFDDAVRDSHASAKGGKEKDDLDGVNIVGDNDELSLLFLNLGGDAVDTDWKNVSTLFGGISTTCGPLKFFMRF